MGNKEAWAEARKKHTTNWVGFVLADFGLWETTPKEPIICTYQRKARTQLFLAVGPTELGGKPLGTKNACQLIVHYNTCVVVAQGNQGGRQGEASQPKAL